MQKRAIAVAAIFLLVGGLVVVQTLGNESAPAPEPTAPTSSAPPEVAQTAPPTMPFNKVGDLRAAMRRGGLACTDFSILEQDNPGLTGFALCDVGSADNRYDFYVFKNSKARNGWIGSIVEGGLPWVFGPNWIVVVAGDPNTAIERAELLQQAIGGQIADVEF